MRGIRLSLLAEADITAVLQWTHAEFGESARRRYEALIAAGLRDLAADPHRAGARRRPELGADLRNYHLIFSRANVVAGIGRVRRPRHLLIYRLPDEAWVEVGRLLHDVIELSRHLPGDDETI